MSSVNAPATNIGGWEKSQLRAKMNSGEIWNLMPADFRSKVKTVRKLTNNVGGDDKNAAVTATTDKLFLLSYSEIVETPYSGFSAWSWVGKEGTQYEAFKGKVTNNDSGNACLQIGYHWWERSVSPYSSTMRCCCVGFDGDPLGTDGAAGLLCVCPAWCF